MNPHQDFIDARANYIARAVEAARNKGLRDEELLVVLADSQAERDTLPGPPPDDVIEVEPSSVRGVACLAMHVVVAQTLLDCTMVTIGFQPQPGFVRVLAFVEGTAFFTHARIPEER